MLLTIPYILYSTATPLIITSSSPLITNTSSHASIPIHTFLFTINHQSLVSVAYVVDYSSEATAGEELVCVNCVD